MTRLFFQYCPKFVLFSEDWNSILLARRHDEVDYEGTFSFIGGKMETTDRSIASGMKREKNEEIGKTAKVSLCISISYPMLFRKKDGSHMIIPHHVARYRGGNIELNQDEYSEFRWVALDEIETFEPKIRNIPDFVKWALKMRPVITTEDFIEI